MLSGKTRISTAILALAGGWPGGPVMALGFGEYRAQVVLGQPLNLAIPVSLAEGESLSSDCASAEVMSGDSRLPPGSVRVRVTQGRDGAESVLRVLSTVAIDEPIVNVTLNAGCPTRITRTLVLLADPPLVGVTTATVEPPASEPAPPPVATPRAPAVTPAPAEAPPPRFARPASPSRATRTAAPNVTPAPAAASPPTARPAPRAAAAPRPPRPAPERAEAARPRLELDRPQVALNQAAVQAAEAQVTSARTAAAAAEAAASSAQQRLKEIETELARVRAEAKAQTDALLQLRQQIVQNQSQQQVFPWLIPALLSAVGLLGLLAGWLAWRLSKQRAQPQREMWWDKGRASVPPSMEAEEDSSYRPSSAFKPSTQQRPPVPMPSAPAPFTGRPEPSYTMGLDSMIAPPTIPAPTAVTIPPISLMDEESKRAVTVDEQIDLEQQADFFIALGHDESAIDLLMAHLRSTGGGTPLPFLKLLEIHRRRGDRDAYERTRSRFNQRFNSVAPEWHSDPGAGRSLEGYPLVVGRIQHAWPHPLDAMAELESLLFRRGAGSEMFDLPAYQEVLFLYQLARDLHQADQPSDAPDTSVDVLLPIGAATEAVPEGTIMLRPEFNAGQSMRLDLDLGAADSAGKAATTRVTEGEFKLDLGTEPAAPKKDS